ncbi:MAG: hypothetical protein NTX71_09175 [Candidatus Aureabacteria bacterium]|nr:hypothetical protein [Candidatus Auribacterota bacterium]
MHNSPVMSPNDHRMMLTHAHPRAATQRTLHALRRGAFVISLVFLALPLRALGVSAESREDAARSSPPEPLPVRVETTFYLLNLTSVNERAETFDADVYIDFKWHDPRLAFAPETKKGAKKIYTEKAAEDKLKEIWWPEVEFVNTAAHQFTNRTLMIHADGTVEYHLGVSATFRTNLNLKRFPFDQQELHVRLQSFLWDKGAVLFTPSAMGCGHSEGDTFDDLAVLGVRTSVCTARLSNTGEEYSEFDGIITAKRNCIFYIWRIFFPAILIMAMSCTVFFVPITDLHDRVTISLTCLLSCIAAQFAISFNLPRISYLTPIDKLYMITYVCIALGVAVSAIEYYFYKRNHRLFTKCNKQARWFVPLLYVILLAAVIFV